MLARQFITCNARRHLAVEYSLPKILLLSAEMKLNLANHLATITFVLTNISAELESGTWNGRG